MRGKGWKGYTLLELLIVLVLIGMIMGMATPGLLRMYNSVSFSIERDEILYQLESLSFAAYERGRGFTLSELILEPTDFFALPEGWDGQVNKEQDIYFNDFGFCEGGEVVFFKQERTLELELVAPLCAPVMK